MSRGLQEAAAVVGASWPYRVAAQLLKRLSGAQISAEELRLLTNRQGQQRANRQQEEAEREAACSTAVAPSTESAEQPMLVGLDAEVQKRLHQTIGYLKHQKEKCSGLMVVIFDDYVR